MPVSSPKYLGMFLTFPALISLPHPPPCSIKPYRADRNSLSLRLRSLQLGRPRDRHDRDPKNNPHTTTSPAALHHHQTPTSPQQYPPKTFCKKRNNSTSAPKQASYIDVSTQRKRIRKRLEDAELEPEKPVKQSLHTKKIMQDV